MGSFMMPLLAVITLQASVEVFTLQHGAAVSMLAHQLAS